MILENMSRLEKIRSPGLATANTELRDAYIDLVGPEVYQTWLMTLRRLVPGGRTHRLSVVVGSFLQYAAQCRIDKDIDDENIVVKAMDELNHSGPEVELLVEVTEFLFQDAGVGFERSNRHGEKYSIAEQAKNEFWRWDFMSWE